MVCIPCHRLRVSLLSLKRWAILLEYCLLALAVCMKYYVAQKTHANRKSMSKSRKHFQHFDSRWCKCSQHKQINFICSTFHFCFCCEHLKRVRCQNDESFLNLQVFFSICRAFVFWLCCEHLQHVHCQNDESCFLN